MQGQRGVGPPPEVPSSSQSSRAHRSTSGYDKQRIQLEELMCRIAVLMVPMESETYAGVTDQRAPVSIAQQHPKLPERAGPCWQKLAEQLNFKAKTRMRS
jgi:hypothetical protein